MKRKNKGFTLIELLAVIVILGLLMAIAIPSVTKYITQSRKKTLTTTIGNYISALTTQVNDMEYIFTDKNTIYAVPIECIALERGGSDSFGEWYPANNSYWAYVLVQYDDKTSSYTYGFTFKDSAGYGLYPTVSTKLKENGKQIVTGLDLEKPVSGIYSNIADKERWTGFLLKDNTKLVVLESDTCKIPKPCVGEGTEIGDVVTCYSESFYVIESTSSTVTMLTEHRINPDLNNPIQNIDADGVKFSNTNYWNQWTGSNNILKPEYGNSYPAYIYDMNSNLYQYVEAYEKYLKEYFDITSANSSLISYEQLVNLGCAGSSCNNSEYKKWLITGYSWWPGSAINTNMMGYVHASGVFFPGQSVSAAYGVRPIITISKEDIKFK